MLTRTAFDPETISLLGAALDQAFKTLPPDDQSQERKTWKTAFGPHYDRARWDAAATAREHPLRLHG
jgi:hypothetical protein